jgi:hypothetical protein
LTPDLGEEVWCIWVAGPLMRHELDSQLRGIKGTWAPISRRHRAHLRCLPPQVVDLPRRLEFLFRSIIRSIAGSGAFLVHISSIARSASQRLSAFHGWFELFEHWGVTVQPINLTYFTITSCKQCQKYHKDFVLAAVLMLWCVYLRCHWQWKFKKICIFAFQS